MSCKAIFVTVNTPEEAMFIDLAMQSGIYSNNEVPEETGWVHHIGHLIKSSIELGKKGQITLIITSIDSYGVEALNQMKYEQLLPLEIKWLEEIWPDRQNKVYESIDGANN